MTIRKINGHESAQVKVVSRNEGEQLVSYSTVVCNLDSDGWLQVTGLHSMTTRKHIGWYMKELGFTYQLAKQLYEDNLKMNIYTGEVKAV